MLTIWMAEASSSAHVGIKFSPKINFKVPTEKVVKGILKYYILV